MNFPAITVCNANSIKLGALGKTLNGLNASVTKRKDNKCFKEGMAFKNQVLYRILLLSDFVVTDILIFLNSVIFSNRLS